MKTLLFSMLIACSLFTTAFAQPVIKAQKDLGARDLDFFTCMALTKDGGRIVGGYSSSNISGQKTDSSRAGFDYWIKHRNQEGKEITGLLTSGLKLSARLPQQQQKILLLKKFLSPLLLPILILQKMYYI